jgi:hypothetical protein
MQKNPAFPPEIPVIQLFSLIECGVPFMSSCEKQSFLITLGGRIRCPRCQATSKRTKQQCMAPASKGKHVCRFHGGKSTGPKTKQGRNRCAIAKTIHGRETRAKRTIRAAKLRELRELNGELKLKGLFA